LVPERAESIARRRLPRHAAARVVERAVRVLAPSEVWRIQPLAWIAGVEVVVHGGAIPRATADMRVEEVPHPIPEDRTAKRSQKTVDIPQRGRSCKVLPSDLLRRFVRLRGGPGAARKKRAVRAIPAALRHDVHHESRGLRLAESASRRERDFLRVTEV